jgi:Uma2 family endonuclease
MEANMATRATRTADEHDLFPAEVKRHPEMPPPVPPPLDAAGVDERALYPVREDEGMTQSDEHYWQCDYLVNALAARFPDRWVMGDRCIYWDPLQRQRFIAPDVAVPMPPRPDPVPDTYLTWRDPPLLFVAEIGSESSVAEDTVRELARYEQTLQVPEYLYAYPERRDLRLWRLAESGYEVVAPDRQGRVYSEQLDLWFGWDNGFLRIWTPGGEMLLTYAEVDERRHAAEEAARQEAARRREAEEAARQEAIGRETAERRIAELLDELKRRGNGGGPAV